MTALQLIPIVLSSLLLSAHAMRAGGPLIAFLVLLLLIILAIPRAWAARTVQVALVLGAVEWVRTLWELVAWRLQAGQPFLRLALILACVALFTLFAAFQFRNDALRQRYGLDAGRAGAGD